MWIRTGRWRLISTVTHIPTCQKTTSPPHPMPPPPPPQKHPPRTPQPQHPAFAAATAIKAYGNTAFKASDLPAGLEKYEKALRYLDHSPTADELDAPTKSATESESTFAQQAALRFALLNNTSMLHLKSHSPADALEAADKALRLADSSKKRGEGGMIGDAERAKAQFRAAQALVELKDDEAAVERLKLAAELAPEDGAVRKELEVVQGRMRRKAEREREGYRKFFS